MKDNSLPEGLIRLNEQYFFGGGVIDNATFNSGFKGTYGYQYNTRSLTHALEMKLPPSPPSFSYINVGSHVSAENRKGQRVTGLIKMITKDSDGYIKRVTILSDKTRQLINVDIDTIKMIGIGMDKDYIDFVRESCSAEKAVVANMIREAANIDFVFHKTNYKAVVLQGMPTILKLNEGKVVSKQTILELNDDEMIDFLLKTKK